MKPLADGTGTTILPYCGLPILVSAAGDALFYGGGLGTRHLYSMKSSPTYPTTAEAIYDLPNDTCCFNGGQALLPDGTVVARHEHGRLRPVEGDLFTSNIPLGKTTATGPAYRIHL